MQKNMTTCLSDNSFWINCALYLISWRPAVQEPRRGPVFCNSVVTASVCVSHRDLRSCLARHVVRGCASWPHITADGPGAMIVWIARPCWRGPIVVDVIVVERLHGALLVEGVSVSWGLLPMWRAGIRQEICLRGRRRLEQIETSRVIWCGGIGERLLLLFYEASNRILMLKLGPTTWRSQWRPHIVTVPADMIPTVKTYLRTYWTGEAEGTKENGRNMERKAGLTRKERGRGERKTWRRAWSLGHHDRLTWPPWLSSLQDLGTGTIYAPPIANSNEVHDKYSRWRWYKMI
jgi:hypothetical protein